ncbi:MAG: PilT/PilU family type 4a pilus ATPase [Planctomycetota bacterium]
MTDTPTVKSVYLVGRNVVNIFHLLERFADPQYIKDGIPRISDLHLKVGEPARYRFDSELLPLPEAAPLTAEVLEDLLFPLLSPANVDRLRSATIADIDAAFEWGERKMSFRINVFRDRDGLACAIRVLPRTIPPLSRIGFPDEQVWRELVGLQQGLVIVTGITGSGKSTTIASMIQHINRSTRARILTLEDPIEYVIHSEHALISQREVGKHVPSFHAGLRSGLREDPDIIFVGEMRDKETASLALTAAETGHLVFSTLHTRDARGAITRIVDLFPPERTKELCAQISFSLSCVIGQKLIPRADGVGRRVVMEVLKMVPAVANQIRTGNWHQIYSTMETHHKDGIYTLERHLKELLVTGEVTKETAIQYANNPGPFLT